MVSKTKVKAREMHEIKEEGFSQYEVLSNYKFIRAGKVLLGEV